MPLYWYRCMNAGENCSLYQEQNRYQLTVANPPPPMYTMTASEACPGASFELDEEVGPGSGGEEEEPEDEGGQQGGGQRPA